MKNWKYKNAWYSFINVCFFLKLVRKLTSSAVLVTGDESECLGLLLRSLHFSRHHRWLLCNGNLITNSSSLMFKLQSFLHGYCGMACKIGFPSAPSIIAQTHPKVFLNVLVFQNRTTLPLHFLPAICLLPETILER